MTASPVRITARHLHLMRAAQFAGEVFACPGQDDGPARNRSRKTGWLIWLSAGFVAAGLFWAF